MHHLRNHNQNNAQGRRICGIPYLGYFGSQIPSSGVNGAGAIYSSLSLPADNGNEYSLALTSWPYSGTLFMYEDTSFLYTPVASGTYTFTGNLIQNGINLGSETITLIIGLVFPVVPSSDITTTGWNATPSGAFFSTLNESVENDSTYVTSPSLPTTPNNLTMGLNQSIPAGTYNINIAGYYSGLSGNVRIHLQNSSSVDQGVSSWTALTNTVVLDVISITTTGTSSQIMIEGQ